MDTQENKKNKPFDFFNSIPDVGNIDIGKIAPVYGLPNPNRSSEPDYIPFNSRGRDFYGRLAFNTGIFWLGGFTAGGVYGIVEGWKGAANPNYKIRINSIMNAFSKRGSKAGNALGILAFVSILSSIYGAAFMHTTSEWVADTIEIERLTGFDAATPIFSGFVTGAVFKSTRGPRAAALAAAIGVTVSTAYWYGNSFVYDKVLGKGGRF